MNKHVKANIERFCGLSEVYHSARPKPPFILLDLLPEIVRNSFKQQEKKIERIVDLGCGTGLSTLFWNEIGKEIIGIEPNAQMLETARQYCKEYPHIKFLEGVSTSTGLEDSSIDMIVCSQSLHWMEPTETFKEAFRILKKGGIFAAVDCDWPPTTSSWKAEKAFIDFQVHVEEIGNQKQLFKDVAKWEKSEHLSRMQNSGFFSFAKEVVVHNVEQGDANRFVLLALSQGSVGTVLRAGISEEILGIPEFKEIVEESLPEPCPFYFSYRVRYGIK